MMNHQNKANMHVNILWITLGEKKLKKVLNLISDIPSHLKFKENLVSKYMYLY